MPTDCVYLFDDIAAELDAQHLDRLFACLSNVKGQLFLTAMDDSIFNGLTQRTHFKLFSLLDGVFSDVSRGTV